MSVVGYRFEFDLSLSPSSSLSSVRPSDQGGVRVSLKARGKFRLVDMVGANLWGKVRGEKGR